MAFLETLLILKTYKYLLIFPVAVVEGPVTIILCGFLVSLGYLNGPLVFIILVVAEIIGDSLYYSMGKKGGSRIKKYIAKLGYGENEEKFLANYFEKHKGKTFLFAKMAHGIGGAVQVTSGMAKVNYFAFLWYSFVGTLIKTTLLIYIGYYAGNSLFKYGEYFEIFPILTIIILAVLITLYILFVKYTKKFFFSERNK